MVLGTRGTAFVINGRPFCFDTKLAVIFKPILPQNLTINCPQKYKFSFRELII